jgi:hypothetical protein
MSGTYEAQISRKTPACVVILLDQSGSMADAVAGKSASKANAAASAVNRLLRVLANTSTKAIGEGPRHYFDIAVLGYRGDVLHGGGDLVTPCLPGSGRGSELVSITTLDSNPIRVEPKTIMRPDGKGGYVPATSQSYIWLDPVASGGTPMMEAMQAARTIIEPWARAHEDSYPPIVMNITDGEPYVDPTAAARRLGEISTKDGSALLYNIHLSSAARLPVSFPASRAGLPDKFAELLFDISSPLPAKISEELGRNQQVDPGARGFIFNADPALLVRFLEVGTRIEVKKGNWDR